VIKEKNQTIKRRAKTKSRRKNQALKISSISFWVRKLTL
jgi:hypothetical protein